MFDQNPMETLTGQPLTSPVESSFLVAECCPKIPMFIHIYPHLAQKNHDIFSATSQLQLFLPKSQCKIRRIRHFSFKPAISPAPNAAPFTAQCRGAEELGHPAVHHSGAGRQQQRQEERLQQRQAQNDGEECQDPFPERLIVDS